MAAQEAGSRGAPNSFAHRDFPVMDYREAAEHSRRWRIWRSRMFRESFPRKTGDVRFHEVTVRILPCPSNPPRMLSAGRATRRKLLPYTFGTAVLRETLVQERVIGAQQFDDARSSRITFSNSNSVSRRIDWRKLSSKSGNRRGSGLKARDCGIEPLISLAVTSDRTDRRASAELAARAP
jgi:hypothetical protein